MWSSISPLYSNVNHVLVPCDLYSSSDPPSKKVSGKDQLNMRQFSFFFYYYYYLNSAQREPQHLSYGILAQIFDQSHLLMHSKAALCAICTCGIIYIANILSREGTPDFRSSDHHPDVFKARIEIF